jgi:hypothetical protein
LTDPDSILLALARGSLVLNGVLHLMIELPDGLVCRIRALGECEAMTADVPISL